MFLNFYDKVRLCDVLVIKRPDKKPDHVGHCLCSWSVSFVISLGWLALLTYKPIVRELPDWEQRKLDATYKKAEFERTLFIALAGSPLMLLYDTFLYKKNISKVAPFEVRHLLRC